LDTFSLHKQYEFHTTKYHCAVIEKSGKVLAFGENKVASPSSGGSCSGGKNHMHAEIHAAKKLGNLYNLKGANMYILRIGKMAKNSNEFVLKYSQPCPSCTKFLNKCIKKYGLQNIYFTCDIQ
jgi:tRNA(Arg) A34 adenosine deaminase TadA